MTGQALTLALQPVIEPALQALRAGSGAQCLSEHAFSNLWLFREAHDYRYWPGDWPGIAGRTYDGTPHFMPLFDVAAAPAAVLVELVRRHGCLYPLADRQVGALPPGMFALQSSLDDADYLYDAATFRDYPGRALAKKRNLVRQFLAAQRPEQRPFDRAQRCAAQAVLQGWMRDKSKATGEADEQACLTAMAHARRFGLEGLVFYESAQPIGFVLAQELQPGVFAMRFAKGLDSHVGLYPYMFQQFCRQLPRPVEWLNFEQDMGLAGFRRSKRSYQPIRLLYKWRVGNVARA